MSHEKKPTSPTPPVADPPPVTATPEAWLDYVRTKIESTKFGSVQIIVHDGRILQVEATEKIRFQPSPPASTRERLMPVD